MLAIMVAAIMIVAAVVKLGFIADLISKPTMIGYMNGLALTILVGQLPKLFGFKVEADGFLGEVTGFVKGLAHGQAVAAAAAVGIAGIVVILVLQRWLRKLLAVLIMVVAAIAATSSAWPSTGSAWSGCSQGVPAVTIPHVGRSDPGPCSLGRWGSRWCPWPTRSPPRRRSRRAPGRRSTHQEMIGIGAANLAAGLFQGFPVSTSGSRTAVAERSGAKTQLTAVTGAAPAGELDCASNPDLSAPLTKLVAKRPHRRVLDLADVVFMDCAGITNIAWHAGPSRQVPAVLRTRPHGPPAPDDHPHESWHPPASCPSSSRFSPALLGCLDWPRWTYQQSIAAPDRHHLRWGELHRAFMRG